MALSERVLEVRVLPKSVSDWHQYIVLSFH
jgi:hypothetical protein